MVKWLSLTGVIVIADQVTKYWVDSMFQLQERVSVLPFFDITLAYNQGAAFSFLADAGGWQRWLFAAIAIMASIAIVVWMLRLKPHEKGVAVALALIIGGALGNLIDRLIFGHVIDFLLFYWDVYYFPAFNVADSAISLGAVIIIFDVFQDVKKEHNTNNVDNKGENSHE